MNFQNLALAPGNSLALCVKNETTETWLDKFLVLTQQDNILTTSSNKNTLNILRNGLADFDNLKDDNINYDCLFLFLNKTDSDLLDYSFLTKLSEKITNDGGRIHIITDVKNDVVEEAALFSGLDNGQWLKKSNDSAEPSEFFCRKGAYSMGASTDVSMGIESMNISPFPEVQTAPISNQQKKNENSFRQQHYPGSVEKDEGQGR